MTPSTTRTKQALRERFQAYRTRLSRDVVAAKSAAICKRVAALPDVRSAQALHCYWPMVERGEIDTRPLIRHLHANDIKVVLPVVTSFEDDSPAMTHRRYTGDGALRPNRWGVQEPTGTDTVSPRVVDGVIVPAFGAGRNGHRIGHGRGYYDAFLAELDVPTITLVYEACLVDTVPAGAHDVPMSTIVTENQTLDVPIAA